MFPNVYKYGLCAGILEKYEGLEPTEYEWGCRTGPDSALQRLAESIPGLLTLIDERGELFSYYINKYEHYTATLCEAALG
jgi:hypothetical protein